MALEDIIGELRGAFDRRDWTEIATILANVNDEQQRAQGYEWLRANLSNAIREPESGANLLASLLAPIAGASRAKVIELGRSDSNDRRRVALGDDGVLREYVPLQTDGEIEHQWVEVEARSLYHGPGVVVPDTWVVAHRTNDINEREVFLEGEDGSFWRLNYGGPYRDRWTLNRWPYAERFTPSS